jgi:site-specific DNA-methyltransferase (adenine-specific)
VINLILGDCIDKMKEIPDGVVDMILCDLPYGTTSCKWDTVIPFDPLWTQYKRVIKKNGAIVLTASQPFTSALGSSNLEMLRYSWVWLKSRATGHLNAKKMPMKSFEDILVFYSSIPTYNPQNLMYSPRKVMNSKSHSLRCKENKTSTVSGGIKYCEYIQEYTNYPRQHIEIPSEGSTQHPTQKPVALMEYLIKTYTNEGELVLDNCMGVGTTGVACKNTNRSFIGIEKDDRYFNIACNRIEIKVKGEK